jgi:signal transduction histidine kinase
MASLRNPSNTTSLPIILTGVLVFLLGLLGFLQYQWVGQISRAERDRLEQSVQTGVQEIGEDVYRELARIGLGFGQFAAQSEFDQANQLSRNYDFWQSTSPYPDLVRDVYVARVARVEELGSQDTIVLERFDVESGSLEPSDWPEPFDELQSRVAQLRDSPRAAFDLMWTRPLGRGGLGAQELDDSIWLLLPGGGLQQQAQFGRGRAQPRELRWTLVEIDVAYLRSEVLPTIIQSHFDPQEYRVGILSADRLIYASDSDMRADDLAEFDAQGAVVRTIPDRGVRGGGPGTATQGRGGAGPAAQGRGGRGRGRAPFTIVGAPWDVRVKHQSGSLEDAVGSARTRNLAVGFGILGLLGISGALTIVWAERARALGRMKMEFAAGMSHELRTPLATIRSAAHNIASGVVKEPDQIREYALMVQTEGRRLSSMVDQVIQFAQTESGRRNYTLKPVSVEEVIESAIATTFPTAEEGAARVRVEVSPALPQAHADETALRHALVNLLVNAVKYGVDPDKEGSPIVIEVSEQPDKGEMQLSVRDDGPGIDPGDLAHVFEPFYRGRTAGTIPGSGLGLNLVKKMMEGQTGRVSVHSKTGQGTTFTLHIKTVRRSSEPRDDR